MDKNSDEAVTKPTLGTILESINALRDMVVEEIGSLRADVSSLRTDVSSLRTDVSSLRTDVSSLGSEFNSFRSDSTLFRSDFNSHRNEFQIFRGEIDIRLDRIESMTNQTPAEMLTLRADFREFRTQLKESIA